MTKRIQSLASRANMDAYDVYKKMVEEVPKDILSQPGCVGFFGSSALPSLVKHRRKYNKIPSTKKNTLITENDGYFFNYARQVAPEIINSAETQILTYEEHKTNGMNKKIKWAISNKPYCLPGQAAVKLWPDLVKGDNLNRTLDWQCNLLPVSLQRGMDDVLIEMRNLFFKQYGLYMIKTLPFDAFKEYGADVDTSIYLCKIEYDGTIRIVTDISSYDYDFRKRGIIVTPDTVDEVDFIFSCLDAPGYNFRGVSHQIDGKKAKKIKNIPGLISKTKSRKHKYPMVERLGKDSLDLVYTSEIIDESIHHDKLAIPYQTSGYDNGFRELGVARLVPAGIQLGGSYRYESNLRDADEINAHAKYLKSLPVDYLLYNWRTTATNDAPQLNVIPKLKDTAAESTEDYIKDMGGSKLKKEIIDGYKRKTRKK